MDPDFRQDDRRRISRCPKCRPDLNQPQRPKADMPVRADHDVVVDADAQPLGDVDDLPGDLYVRAARVGLAARMVMDLSAFSEIDMIINMLQ